jgi:glycosyltransferase involved in cell wall biosynthesis
MKNSHNNMHVLYLPRWYPNRYDPMPGLFIERHARSVAPYCKVSVLYVHADENPLREPFEFDVSQDEHLLQVKVYFKVSKARIPALRRFFNTIRFISAHRKGYRIIKKESGQADLIHVNVLTRLGVLAMVHKFMTGTPYVITEHWTRYLPNMDNFKGPLRKWFTRQVVKNASAVLPVTHNLRQAMESHGLLNRNYVIIPNVVDINLFSPAKEKNAISVRQIIHVSCFEDKQKNISGLLRMLKQLSQERENWKCHMVGDGIHFQKLVSYAEEIGLPEKQVIFHGLKENEELAELMKNADFQVMFSRFENLPVVILESYACGVPVLSTRVGGIHEHMNADLGLLIESEDEGALLEKLKEMLDHAERYDKDKIRKYAEEHFSEEVIGKQLWKVYKDVAG